MLRHYLRQAADRITQIVYARRRFKLLMRTSLRDIDLRVQALAAATNFFSSAIRPVVIVASSLPSGNLAGEGGLVGGAAHEALALEDADVDLGHIQPTRAPR